MERSSDQTVVNPPSLASSLLSLGGQVLSFSWKKAENHLPQLTSSATTLVERSQNELLPQVKKGLAVVLETAKVHVAPAANKASTHFGIGYLSQFHEGALPMLKKSVVYGANYSREHVLPRVIEAGQWGVETVQLHPWKSGSVLLLLYFFFPGLLGLVMRVLKMLVVLPVNIFKWLLQMMIQVPLNFYNLLMGMMAWPVKMMKAPGRKGSMISRNVFERDPSGYFRTLRGK